MKPLPSRPPISSRRSQVGGEGGEDEGELRDGVLSSARRVSEVDRANANPTWMRKLEDRYQRLHRKIAAIPTSNTPASRFNFLTRKFLNETLAKARKQAATNNTNTPSNTVTTAATTASNTRISSTAPNFTTYKDTEQFVSPPSDDDDSDSNDPNDENLPPGGTGGPGTLKAEKSQKTDLLTLSQYYPQTLYSRYHPHPAAIPHPYPALPHRQVRGGSVGSVEGINHTRRSPLLECDDSLEGNATMAAGLAGHLAHVSPSLPARGGGHCQDSATSRPVLTTCAGFSGGQSNSLLPGGNDQHTDAGDRDAATNTWLDRHMADLTASGVRTLNSTSTAGSRRGTMVHAAQSRSQYSYITTKSCPAIFTSNNSPSGSRRRSGSHRPEPRDKSGRQNMRVFAQMSMEARHAITETLKEMGALGGKGNSKEKEEEGDNPTDNNNNNSENVDNTLPSLPEPAPTAPPAQRRSKPLQRTSTMGSRDPSLQTSHKTLPRQRSVGVLRYTDTTSSVNATVKGGRSPGRAHKKARSINTRASCKSAKTLATCVGVCSEDVDKHIDTFEQLSMASAGKVSSDRSSPELRLGPPLRMQFPVITSHTEPEAGPGHHNHLQHINYRIQGVGSYWIPRERTFEITAPDFDIRYRDVITCQKGDGDTPPPDIFEKSVGKVHDWLNKYFFQS